MLATILSDATLAGVTAAAAAPGPLSYPDDLWAATVFEFLLAYHRAVMTREHVTQTLLPLYLGRTASFLLQYGSSGPAVVLRRARIAGPGVRAGQASGGGAVEESMRART